MWSSLIALKSEVARNLFGCRQQESGGGNLEPLIDYHLSPFFGQLTSPPSFSSNDLVNLSLISFTASTLGQESLSISRESQ